MIKQEIYKNSKSTQILDFVKSCLDEEGITYELKNGKLIYNNGGFHLELSQEGKLGVCKEGKEITPQDKTLFYSKLASSFGVKKYDIAATGILREKLTEANSGAFNLIKSTKWNYLDPFDDLDYQKNIDNIQRAFGVVDSRIRADGDVPVSGEASIGASLGGTLTLVYNDGIFSFIFTDEKGETSQHYLYKIEKNVGVFILTDNIVTGSVNYSYDSLKGKTATPIYVREDVGSAMASHIDKLTGLATRMKALIKMYEKALEQDKQTLEQNKEQLIKEALDEFKANMKRVMQEFLEKNKQEDLDKHLNINPDIYEKPSKTLEQQLSDAIEAEQEKLKKRLEEIFEQLKKWEDPSKAILRMLSDFWHKDFHDGLKALEGFKDNQKYLTATPDATQTDLSKDHNFLVGLFYGDVDNRWARTKTMVVEGENKVSEVVYSNRWSVTDVYKVFQRYDINKVPFPLLAGKSFDWGAEPLSTSLTSIVTDNVGMNVTPFAEGFRFNDEIPNPFTQTMKNISAWKRVGKCNRNINTHQPSTEIIPLEVYVQRSPQELDTWSKIMSLRQIGFVSMYNMTSHTVLNPTEKEFYRCFSLGRRRGKPTKLQVNQRIETEEEPDYDTLYGFPGVYGLAFHIGGESNICIR